MRLVFIGPPGAGKGTQAARVCGHFSIRHLSTGEILRESVQAETRLGKLVGPLMQDGRLVNDELIIDVVRERLGREDCVDGFLLDGFPRTVPQAEALVELLVEFRWQLTSVIEIRVPHDELTRRLKSRANQAETPRADDSLNAIPTRLEVYRDETKPLISFYEERGQLLTVDGVGTMDEVYERLIAGVEAIRSK